MSRQPKLDRWMALGVVGVAALTLWPAQVRAQARSLRPIAPPPWESADGADLTQPGAGECAGVVREIAAAYGPDDLGPWLHELFPNRAQLMDALSRLDLRVSRLELRVESLESIRIVPAPPGDRQEIADCLADVRTRLVYDDLETGQRVVAEPRRGQWHLRVTRAEEPEEATP